MNLLLVTRSEWFEFVSFASTTRDFSSSTYHPGAGENLGGFRVDGFQRCTVEIYIENGSHFENFSSDFGRLPV